LIIFVIARDNLLVIVRFGLQLSKLLLKIVLQDLFGVGGEVGADLEVLVF
jgi:hypothetical protein